MVELLVVGTKNCDLSSRKSKGLVSAHKKLNGEFGINDLCRKTFSLVFCLNIISFKKTFFASLARGNSCCWESSRSLYLCHYTLHCSQQVPKTKTSPPPQLGENLQCWDRKNWQKYCMCRQMLWPHRGRCP